MPEETVTPGYCECGCETYIGFWDRNNRAHGHIKGQPKRFVRGHQGRPLIDETGHRYGRLTVIRKEGRTKDHHPLWLCRCDCGNELHRRGQHLRRVGDAQSCGCLAYERAKARSTTHGHKPTGKPSPTYNSWDKMKQRCLNANHTAYPRYGGRGIEICSEWQGDFGFENFLADMGERPVGKTLDRINNDGNYEPSNCRWATPKQQANNRRPRR